MQNDHNCATATTYRINRNVQLAGRTTFRTPARAALLADVWDCAALPELLARPEARDLPLLVLGGGSNVLFTQDFNGLVIHLCTRGIELLDDCTRETLVRVAAGEDWDGFVRWALAEGLGGLENLILIPGSVGAAPIQNIGAYGVEAAEFVETVETWDRLADKPVRHDKAACAFGYRDSLFKCHPQRFIVTHVEFRLPRQRPPRLDYPGICRELAAAAMTNPAPTDVARAVERLRRRKLPDLTELGNAGSFFKNPVVAVAVMEKLRRNHAEMPVYPQDAERCKLSAAWLIEACGLKGLRIGDAGVSERHALVLVNYGKATGAQIWALAQRVRNQVAACFGIVLEPEPLVL